MLYRAAKDRFPLQWTAAKTVSTYHLERPTIARFNGTWWILGTYSKAHGAHLWVLHAQELLGAWDETHRSNCFMWEGETACMHGTRTSARSPHPLTGRAAGNMFVHKGRAAAAAALVGMMVMGVGVSCVCGIW